MKNLWRLLLSPILAAALLLVCTPTNAAHRGGSAYDGTWSVAIYTLRGDCGSVRAAVGSSVAACIPRTKATKRPAVSVLTAWSE